MFSCFKGLTRPLPIKIIQNKCDYTRLLDFMMTFLSRWGLTGSQFWWFFLKLFFFWITMHHQKGEKSKSTSFWHFVHLICVGHNIQFSCGCLQGFLRRKFVSTVKIWMTRKDGVQVYRYVPKFSDRQVWANSADQSDQGLHCLQFPLHLLDALL